MWESALLSHRLWQVTGKSIIDVYDYYDFLGIWEDIREKVGDEEVFFIIDNAKTHLPLGDGSEVRGLLF